MDYIMDNLYISNMQAAANHSLLILRKITHILIVANTIKPPYPKEFNYMIIPAEDLPTFNIAKYFEDAAKFIDDGRKAGKVLVHCACGISRSATIVIWYVMRKIGHKVYDAIDYVKSKHSATYPNPGFIAQLKEMEIEKKKCGKAKSSKISI